MRKKEMKEEKLKAQEIKISYEPGTAIYDSEDYESGRMVFKIGDQEFYLEEKTASSLFGRNTQIKFEHIQGKDESMGGLNTLENYVLVMRLMKKGLNLELAAKILRHPSKKVKALIGLAQREKNYFLPVKYDREWERQSDKEDYVKARTTGEERPGEKPRERFIDLLMLSNKIRNGWGKKQLADFYQADEKSFNEFMEKNQKYLDLLAK